MKGVIIIKYPHFFIYYDCMGCVKRKCIRTYKIPRFRFIPSMRSLIRAFALHRYILLCQLILLADSEGPDQTVRMRRRILVFAVRICLRTRFSHGATRLVTTIELQRQKTLSDMFVQRRFRSDCAFAHSDLNLHWTHFG